MKTNLIASMLAVSLFACGSTQVDSGALGQRARDTAAKGAGGGGGGGGGGSSGRFEMGANNLFFNPNPARGEVSLSGFVVVTSGPISTGSFIPPADTVVTANGVALMRDPALNGAFYRVDPAGPQPQVTNGQLTLSASSASAGVSRLLVLPCAGDETITASPGAGASLGVVSSLALSWNASLTSHTITIPVPEFGSAVLYGYDPATNALGNAVSLIPVVGTLGTTLAVAPTDSPAYAAVVSWPGQYRLDGQSGGQCGRTKRLVFAK
jgi:hypothetical protein